MSRLLPKRYLKNFSPLQRRADDLWDRFMTNPFRFSGLDEDEWIPATDINDKDDRVIVTAELPGLSSDDIDVSISGDLVTIKGEKKKEEESDKVFERYYGSFQRSLRLGSEVDSDKAEADFKDGVLKIVLPKLEDSSRKSIDITTH